MSSTSHARRIPSSPPSLPGHDVVRGLDQGGMGSVWEVVEHSTSRTLAAKVLHPQPRGKGLSAEENLALFDREITTLASLSHEGIVHLISCGCTREGLPFFTMDLVEGTLLDTYCEEQKLDTRARVSLCRSVAAAMGYAHARGVVHRDLKPTNILVTREGLAKVLDFGLAKAHGQDSLVPGRPAQQDSILGSLRYLSPEQARGDTKNLGTYSDVWALGVILYRLLSGGKHPFPEEPASEIIPHILNPAGIRPLRDVCPHVAPDLAAIVQKCLSYEPDHRYSNGTELAADLQNWLEDGRWGPARLPLQNCSGGVSASTGYPRWPCCSAYW